MKYILILFLLLVGCRKDSPKIPAVAALVYPLQNSECGTGEDISETTSRIEFQWEAANNTEIYELKVINLNTNITQTASTENISLKFTLEKGTPYSWSVTTKNSEVDQTAVSDTWRFYNAGSLISYAPFPAEIIAPLLGTTISKDMNNEVTLDWSGADVEDDIEGYQVFFSIANPPETEIASLDEQETDFKVSVEANTVYFWRIITKDEQGNTSDSGIYEFKVF